MKIALGTVQFGMDYGISNKAGKTPLDESRRIIGLARAYGIKIIDTAAAYGESERVLGEVLGEGHDVHIVTKVPKIGKSVMGDQDAVFVQQSLMQSLSSLRQSAVYGLLLHHPDDLLAENGRIIYDQLCSLKDKGLVKKIGISVYSKVQIDRVLDRYGSIDLIQAPVNVLDQGLLKGGYLAGLKKKGIEIHSRSVFLQGLLLMDPDQLTHFPAEFRAHLKKIRQDMKQRYQDVHRACLGFVLANPDIDAVVCGVNTAGQLTQLIDSSKGLNIRMEDFKDYAITDESILNPSQWAK